jgi:hypothetical protein
MSEFTPEFFDEASVAWRKNKISIGNGSFAYRCNYIHTNKKQCNKIVSAQVPRVKYRIREDWITPSYESSLDFCVKHRFRGPKQQILGSNRE